MWVDGSRLATSLMAKRDVSRSGIRYWSRRAAEAAHRLMRGLERSMVIPWILFAMVSLVIGAVLAATRLGIGATTDSAGYLSSARSFVQNGSFTTFYGEPLTVFPLGYPLLLALIIYAGGDPLVVARGLNAAFAGASVIVVYALARTILRRRAIALAVAAGFAVSWSTPRVFAMLWTEPLFSLLVLLTLLGLSRACSERGCRALPFLGAAFACALAGTVRYAGVALIAPILSAGIRHIVQTRRLHAWILAGTGALIATSGLGLSVLQSYLAGVPAGGKRYGGGVTAWEAGRELLHGTGRLLFPIFPATNSPSVAPVIVGVLMMSTCIFGMRLERRLFPGGSRPIWIFLMAYLTTLALGSMIAVVDPIDVRLLQPALAPLLIVLAGSLASFRGVLVESAPSLGLGRGYREQFDAIVLAMVLGLLAINMSAGVAQVQSYWSSGVPGLGRAASASSTIAAIRTLPAGGVAATNPALVFWGTLRVPVTPIPRADRYWPDELAASSRGNLLAKAREGEIRYLIVFDEDAVTSANYDLSDAGVETRLVGEFGDGRILEVFSP